MMSYGWTGGLVRLVPLDRAKHLQNAQLWMNDPTVTGWIKRGDLPVTMLAEEAWFDNASKTREGEIIFAIETLDANEHIGFSDLHKIDFRHGFASTGTLTGRTDLWGRGYGTDAARVRTRYAFEVLGLRMLYSEAFAENTASLKMLQNVGYQEVGRIPRRYWKRGAWRDIVMMCVERDV